MKVIISPAKSLELDRKLPTKKFTQAVFLEEAEEINQVLKSKSAKDLGELMNISPELSQLNYERNQQWSLPFTADNARPAIYAFNGEVYRGLDAYTIPIKYLNQLQKKVRILSGMYGLLKPLDLVQPYRLEMGTKLGIGDSKNLYGYWKERLTQSLNAEMKENEILLNLASVEYVKAIDPKQLKPRMVQVDFKDLKGDKYKTISVYAKHARGLMSRFVVENKVESLDQVKAFDGDGYRYHEQLSEPEHLVFSR